MRRLSENDKLQTVLESAIQPDRVSLDFISTDTNLYMAFAHLLSLTKPASQETNNELKIPTSFREGLKHFEGLADKDGGLGLWLGDESAQNYFR